MLYKTFTNLEAKKVVMSPYIIMIVLSEHNNYCRE